MNMGSKSIVFVLLPFPSHYFACFPYARKLQNEGYQVSFVTSANRRTILESERFQIYEITYIMEYSVPSAKVFIGLFLRSLLDKTTLSARFRNWLKATRSIHRVLETCNPTKVLLDDHLAHYYPIIHLMCADIEIVNTKLSTKKSSGFPPLNSAFVPGRNIASKIICELLWYRHLIDKAMNDALVKIALLYRDEDYFSKRLAERSGYNFKNLIDRENCFYSGLHNVRVSILAPSALEFPGKVLKVNERYLDFPIARNEEYLFTAEYYSLLNDIKLHKEKNRKVIYCAFGTLSHAYKEKVISFVERLFVAVKEESQWLLIVSTAGIPFAGANGNILLADQVPQLNLLQYCDLMISHGGLTSIKECLQQKVPMLIYPLNEKMDQPGNAARVQYHGLGLRGDISTDHVKTVKKKIRSLLTESCRPVTTYT